MKLILLLNLGMQPVSLKENQFGLLESLYYNRKLLSSIIVLMQGLIEKGQNRMKNCSYIILDSK